MKCNVRLSSGKVFVQVSLLSAFMISDKNLFGPVRMLDTVRPVLDIIQFGDIVGIKLG